MDPDVRSNRVPLICCYDKSKVVLIIETAVDIYRQAGIDIAVHELYSTIYFCPNPLRLKNPLGLFPAFPLVEDPEGGGKNERP
jgi:hypothetical protein